MIIVNSTIPRFSDPVSLPIGQWIFRWDFSSERCIPGPDGLEYIFGGAWGGEIIFATVYEGTGGTSIDLTNCPIVALDVPYVANWTLNCPEMYPTYSGATACDSKLDAAQVSSISAALQMSTVSPTASSTGYASVATGTWSSSSGPSSSISPISPTHTNAVGKSQPEWSKLGAVAFGAGLGAVLF